MENKPQSTGDLDGKTLNSLFWDKADQLAAARVRNKKPRAADYLDEVQHENNKREEQRLIETHSVLPPIVSTYSEASKYVGCSESQLRSVLKNVNYLKGCVRNDSEVWSRQVYAHKAFILKQLGRTTRTVSGGTRTLTSGQVKNIIPNREDLVRLGGLRLKNGKN